jgi:branched-chain amino acid aminotransferase
MNDSAAVTWHDLKFRYLDTGTFVHAVFRDHAWSRPKVCVGSTIPVHIAATCLHYGQACFEGLKAFRRADGTVAAFRPEAHARRLGMTARRLAMAAPDYPLFLESVRMLLKANDHYVPPHGVGASFYLRPLLIGSSPLLGVHASDEYLLLVFGTPVGAYYTNGLQPVRAYVQERYDRAAPRGVGHVKAAGNYAATLLGDREVHEMGFQLSLFLDSETRGFIDEFGTSNFVGITRDGRYVTPKSESILESITNDSLRTIAADLGMTVEHRPVRWDEIEDFVEIGACGTAAVITPIYSITRGEKTYCFGSPGRAGPTLERLYNTIQDIQFGRLPDRHNWMVR